MSAPTIPVSDSDSEDQHAPFLTASDSVVGPDGAFYLHKDLTKASEPWAAEEHVSPIKTTEQFGDVESWCTYVQVYEEDERSAHLTWNEQGLRAVLDYHNGLDDPGRCQWLALHQFRRSPQWEAWITLANGQAKSQRGLIEALEDLSDDVQTPDSATLVGILRTLRASVSKNATTELNEDGSTRVAFDNTARVNQTGELSIPNQITIAIPALKGHTKTDDVGKVIPVLYSLPVRIRVSVDDNAHLVFRLSMPTAERVLEAVYLDRVEAAKSLLGPDAMLLRAG